MKKLGLAYIEEKIGDKQPQIQKYKHGHKDSRIIIFCTGLTYLQ